MQKIKNVKKGIYIWLLMLIAFFVLFNVFKSNMAAMQWLVQNITTPYKRAMGAFCSRLSFSVAEIIWAIIIIGCITFVIYAIMRTIKEKKNKAVKAFRFAVTALCIALTVYAGFTFLWGANYYTASFNAQSGIEPKPITKQQLYETTCFFADKANETAVLTQRTANGLYKADLNDVFAKSKGLYSEIEIEYPFIKGADLGAKPMYFSKILSIANYTGFYFPFTGESNINIDAPSAFIPSTIAHEIAHQRGIAPEQTANFLAVRVCELSEDVNYNYSGWLMGYVYLINALYSADKTMYHAVADKMSPLVNADLEYNNVYWQKYQSKVADAVDATYSGFLKSYSQELGSKSYGAVVDLLVAYYGNGK
ncbi:MAG: DUF3810 domain-containing protein [Oscillospiraceae bacterium]